MRHRLLLIGDPDFPLATLLDGLDLDAEVSACGISEWIAASRRLQASSPWDLFVATVFDATHEWGEVLRWIAAHANRPPVLAVLRPSLASDFLASVARGVDDFIVWSAERRVELRERIARLLCGTEHSQAISERLTQSVALSRLVGQDPGFLRAIAKIPVVARSSAPVLILGETGTGKELCARAVHHLSARRNQPFVPVDCAALPDHLLENELFGHVRGAFTDAHRDQGGLVAMAEGGTLFLDEVDSLAASVQAKLLRLIEERTYKPLGADRYSTANIRIVAAGNRPLEEMVRQRQFRSDLFFRLNVLPLHLPPLRERRNDIPHLAQHFVQQLCSESGLGRKSLAPAAHDALMRAEWPGNVRELFNVIQRAVVFSEGPVILAHHVALSLEPSAPDDAPREEETGSFRVARDRALRTFERAYVETLLRKHQGNVTRSAAEAGKDRRAFGRLIKRHAIDRRLFESR